MAYSSIKRTEGGFQKLVFENVVDTLAGGLILDLDGYEDAVEGFVPAGTLVGIDKDTGLGKVVKITPATEGGEEEDPTDASFDIEPIGLTIRNSEVNDNTVVGVVISGTARIAALPTKESDNADAIAKALPRITLV